MSDILERLKACLATASVDFDMPTDPLEGVLKDAIAEITYLRSLAGAVSDGPSMADIKARVGSVQNG